MTKEEKKALKGIVHDRNNQGQRGKHIVEWSRINETENKIEKVRLRYQEINNEYTREWIWGIQTDNTYRNQGPLRLVQRGMHNQTPGIKMKDLAKYLVKCPEHRIGLLPK